MTWESVIGLEVHVRLKTRSKLFSGAANGFGAAPNDNACPVDLALPGALPVLNAEAVDMAALFGVAVAGQVADRCRFDRKSYFYPDLPKGYQISQFDEPIVRGGRLWVTTANGRRPIALTRAHLEEDAGKSLHDARSGQTGIDLNRAGVPLLEVVSEPELRAPAEAAAYFRALHSLVRYLGISDGNLNEGSLRCDANVSVRRPGASLGERTEIKNLNSFRFLEKALRFEIARQVDVLESGGSVARETLLYDAERDETRPMRGKELSDDYRYFPDPDLLPVLVTAERLAKARAALPELPDAKRERYLAELNLTAYEADWLVADPQIAGYFEAVSAACGQPKAAANWVMGVVAAVLRRDERAIADAPVPPVQLARLVERVADDTLSGAGAKRLFERLWSRDAAADDFAGDADEVDRLIDRENLGQVSDSGALEELVLEVVAANPAQARQFRDGRAKVLGFFMGQVMKATKGKANPRQARALLSRALAG